MVNWFINRAMRITVIFGIAVFLLILEVRTVDSFLPVQSLRISRELPPVVSSSFDSCNGRNIAASGAMGRCAALRMSTIAAPSKVKRETSSLPNINMPIVTVPKTHRVSKEVENMSRNAFLKGLTKQNKRNMKDGVRLREEYVKYRLMTSAEEMTAGKFSAVGKKLKDRKASLMKKLGRDISIEEWAESCKLSVQNLELYLSVAKRARNRLIQHNMNLVDFHARSIIGSSSVGKEMPYFQLVAEGTVGLSEAVESYDGRGRFSVYANPFIRSRIFKAITTLRPGAILSHSSVMTYYRAIKARVRMTEAMGREPTIAELAAELKISVANVKASMRDGITKKSSISAQSVLMLSEENEPTTYLDLFLCGRQNARSDDATTWHSDFLTALSCLDASERRTLEVRYGLLDGNPRSVEDTAELMAVSEESVRKLVNSSFDKLRNSCRSTRLEEGVPQSTITTLNGKKGDVMY